MYFDVRDDLPSLGQVEGLVKDLRILTSIGPVQGYVLELIARHHKLCPTVFQVLYDKGYLVASGEIDGDNKIQFNRYGTYPLTIKGSNSELFACITNNEIYRAKIRINFLNRFLHRLSCLPDAFSFPQIPQPVPESKKHCLHCSKEMPEGKSIRAIYCSKSCKQLAYLKRKKSAGAPGM